MELKIEKERVLKAASTCPQAKDVLRELFPEVFENKEIYTLPKLPIFRSIKDGPFKGQLYLLVTLSDRKLFVSLENGNRWNSTGIQTPDNEVSYKMLRIEGFEPVKFTPDFDLQQIIEGYVL